MFPQTNNQGMEIVVARICLLVAVLVSTEVVSGEDGSWVLHGKVVDQQGRSVADVGVGRNWCANGVTQAELHRILKEQGDKSKLSLNEGQMEPWGQSPSKTDADGIFSLEMGWRDHKALAIDKERQRGALIVLDSRNPAARVQATLAPLVRMHGRVRIAATEELTKEVTVVVRLPDHETFPLGVYRLAVCNSQKSRFEFLLPPGEYQFEVFGHDPPDYVLEKSPTVRLSAGQREYDCGFLDLTPKPEFDDPIEKAKENGTWVDYSHRYGQPAPQWHCVDSRGVAKGARIADFRGKWLLVYFWGPSCAPCMGKTLPQLTSFYEKHKGQRDRFEIVSICLDPGGELNTMADLDRILKPVVQANWKGKSLPFPVLLDNTYESMLTYGMEYMGTKILIDPTGRMVRGDEETLEAILAHTAQKK